MPTRYLRKLAVILSSLLRERCIPPSAAVPDAPCGRILANAAVPIILMDAFHASDLVPKMRTQFGLILTIPIRLRISENMVWTNSQDYGADEILHTSKTTLFHKITRFTSEIITLFRIPPQLFPKGLSPRNSREIHVESKMDILNPQP